MRPLPNEEFGSASRNPHKRGGNSEIRKLTDRIIAYTDLDRENDSDVVELIDATRRQLLKARTLRQAKAKKKKTN